jgi:tetratricopeptide (TPR) repeat protein
VLDPSRIDLRFHCARALRETHRFEEAERLLDECLEREPYRADLLHEHALICLHAGRWREAWPDYEARLQLDPLPAWTRRSARWSGERIGGKRVVLVEEQGAGHSLWAARYIALLARRGAALSLVLDRELHPLLAALPLRLLAPDDACLELEDFDFHAPLMSLPWLVDPRGATIPEPTSVAIDDRSREHAASLLDGQATLRLGVSLRGAHAAGLDRVPELGALPGVRLYSLDRDHALERNCADVQALGSQCRTFGELAAAIDALDLVITTDQPLAHVAGCLDTPVLALLTHTPHWIWGTRGDSVPWYPGMRLLRQGSLNDWGSVGARAASARAQMGRDAAPGSAPCHARPRRGAGAMNAPRQAEAVHRSARPPFASRQPEADRPRWPAIDTLALWRLLGA